MSLSNVNLRLEMFCDAVFAIAMTLLIIDLKIPEDIEINSTSHFWSTLKYISPSIFSFVLSCASILIVWFNHHSFFELIDKSSSSFIYANGLMLLSVVFLPFPTSLLGEYILTDYASPAVILYELALAVGIVGWILMVQSVLKNNLAKSESLSLYIRKNLTLGYYALVIYLLFAFIAIWFPVLVAIATAFLYVFWVFWGIKLKDEHAV